ncbi:HD domain-containing protein [soil metagenome]
MTRQHTIANTEGFVKELLINEGTGHDWWHAVRVSSAARDIQRAEGGDAFVIDLASLLHDIGDRKVIHKTDDDYTIAENFLNQQELDKSIVDQIMFIIKNMSYSKNLRQKLSDAPIELKIVQDADRLDAIGAIGIARMFTYGGSRGRVIFDPEVSDRNISNSDEYKKPSGSSFHHFEEKLLHLKDLLNTDTAKTIAENRDAFMRQYIQQFKDEINGLK